jgi:hypothetical protein
MPAVDKLILGNIVRGGGVRLRHFLLRGRVLWRPTIWSI